MVWLLLVLVGLLVATWRLKSCSGTWESSPSQNRTMPESNSATRFGCRCEKLHLSIVQSPCE